MYSADRRLSTVSGTVQSKDRSADPHADIMIVDDQAANLQLLEEMLKRKGHTVRPFSRGLDALKAAQELPPDLVLLDINMPEMNGYEVCTSLKAAPSLAEIPVIFLSARDRAADKVQAFRVGGLDYISKPFEFEEVHARVETHVRLHRLQSLLRDQNLNLETLVELRTRELASAHQRLAMLDLAKSDFLQMISHELRTPLNGLLCTAELMLSDFPKTGSALELREMFEESRERILSVVDSALLLTQLEIEGGRFPLEPVPLMNVLVEAGQCAARLAEMRGVRIDVRNQEIGCTTGDRHIWLKALGSLIETAVKFSHRGDAVVVSQSVTPHGFAIAMETRTGHIPPAALPRFFDLFGISDCATSAGPLGLTPALAGRIISLFGGTAEAENLHPEGIRLVVYCPCSA